MKILTIIENPQAHSSRSVVMYDGNPLEMGHNIRYSHKRTYLIM